MSTHARSVLHGTVLAAVGAAFVLTAVPAEAAGLAATASVQGATQYVGDSTGVTYTVKVKNTGTRSVSAVQIDTPYAWRVAGCPSAPLGWSRSASSRTCRYSSPSGVTGDLLPGGTATFTVKATTLAGPRDARGTWKVIARAERPTAEVVAAPMAPGLSTTAYSLELTRAVFREPARLVGFDCPSPGTTGKAGSTGVIVVCGRNHTTSALALSPSLGRLQGTFATPGTLRTGTVNTGTSSKVIGSWTGVTVTSVAGPGKTVVLRMASASYQSSPVTTFGGYTATNGAPTAAATSVSTDEDAPVSVSLRGSDPDGDSTSFSIVSGPTKGLLGTITAPVCSGTVPRVCTADLLYFPSADTNGADSFSYRVTDPFGGAGTAVASITVRPVNDVPTALALSASSVAEGQPVGTPVGTLSASDVDTGDTKAFTLVSGAGSADNALFAVSGTTLQTAAVLDKEAQSSFSVRVRVTDSGGSFVERAFALTATDVNEAPTDLALSASTVAENLPSGSPVGTLSTTDPDAGDTHTYALLSSADAASFALSGSSLVTAATLDFETQNSYALTIRSTDSGGLSVDEAVTVSVTDANDAPTAIALSNATVAENQPAGTSVGTLSATDQDATDTLTFSLVDTATFPDNAVFQVSGTDLQTAAVLDLETRGSYTVKVRVSDGAATFDRVLSITVTNTNDPPTDLALSGSTVPENAPGATVGTLSATDPDGDPLLFTLVSGTGSTDNASFAVVGALLQAPAGFDRESKSTYSVRVRAADGAGGQVERAFVVTVTDVNEAPTDVALDNASVVEHSVAGTLVGNLSATDPDAGDTATFALVAGAGDTHNASFQVNGSRLEVLADLTAGSVTVRVRVTDSGGLTFDEAFALTVTPANLAPTDVALSPSSVAENAPSGTAVGTLTATDPDAGNTHGFTLVAGTGATDNAAFSISGSTLQTAVGLDFEAGGTRSVRVRATDQGGLFFDKALTVTVTNINDAPTDLSLSPATVAENQPSGTTVGSLSTTDQDAGATHTFTLVPGTGSTDNASFALSGSSLQTAASFDAEAKNAYSVRIRSTDNGGLLVEKAFIVTVTDVAEAPTASDLALAGASRAVGNTALVVDDPSDGAPDPAGPQKTVTADLLSAATDPDAGSLLTLVPGTFATNDGGSVVVQADGDLTYLPKAGTSCSDLSDFFDYTVTDGGLTDVGRVTITLADCVWYVDPSAAAGGDGTSGSPFSGLTSLTGAGDVDGPGSTLFLYDGTVGGGLALEASQALQGQRHGLTVADGGSGTLTLEPAVPGGAASAITGGLVLATGNVVQGIDLGSTGSATTFALSGVSVGTATVNTVTAGQLDNPAGVAVSITGSGNALAMAFTSVSSAGSSTNAINLTGTTGTFSAGGGLLTDAVGADVLLSGGTVVFTYNGTISDDVGQLVAIASSTGGTKDFNGLLTDLGDGDGSGIALTGNTGATVRFDGGLTLATGANPGLTATGGGTVVATQDNVAVVNTVATTTATAVNVTSTGIGADGLTFRSIQVGSAGSGPVNGIVLNSTGAAGGLTVSGNGGACAARTDACSGGTVQATSGDALSLSSTQAVSLTRLRVIDNLGNGIRGSAVTGFALTDSVLDNNADDGATDEAGLHLTNLAGVGSIVRTLVSGSVEDNARILNSSGVLTQLSVTDSTFRDTDAVSPGNNGLLLQADGTAIITADVLGSTFLRNRANGLQVVTNGAGTIDVEVDDSGTQQSTFDDNNIGVSIAHNSTGGLSFGVRDLTIDGRNVAAGTGGSASPVNLNLGGSATTLMSGSVTGNTLTNSDSSTGPGLRVTGNGTATMTVLVSGNTISQVANRGIEVIARDGSNRVNATIVNNSVTLTDPLAADAIRVDAGAVSTDTTSICADIRSNTTSTIAGFYGIRLRQRFAGTTFQLEGYTGAATSDTDVGTFLSAANNGSTALADHAGPGYAGSGGCPTPA